MQAALTKNINDQLERLLSQLSDLEELKEDLTDEEYAEMKADTLAQIEEFEKFLEKNKAENAELAGQAAKQLEDEKRRILGMQAMKEMVEGQNGKMIRERLVDLKFQFTQKKSISEDQYGQMVIAQFSLLEKCPGGLTEEEKLFKQAVLNKGAQGVGSGEISE